VVGDLQQVHPGQSAADELRVDLLLDIAGKQEAVGTGLRQEDDRHVVDGGAAVRRPFRHPVRVGPEHLEADPIEAQAVASDQPAARWATGPQGRRPGLVAGTWPERPGLVDAADAVAREQRGQSSHVVLVRVRQHEDVDAAIPRRQSLVERDQESSRVGPAIDQEATAPPTLDQDAVALTDVKDHDAGDPVGPVRERDRERNRCGRKRHRRHAGHARVARLLSLTVRRDDAPAALLCHGPRLQARSHTRRRPLPDRCPHPNVCPVAPPRHPADQAHGQRGTDDIPRRAELDAGERQRCPGADRRDHRGIQRPRGQADQDGQDLRQAHACQDPGAERQRPGRHGRGDEGHDDEVHRRRDERQPAELQQHDRRRRCLGRKRDAEDLGQQAPWATRSGAGKSLRQRRAPGEDPRRREDGQAEARIVDPRRIEEQERGDGPAEGRGGGAGPAELAREQRHARHHARAHDRWRGPDERDVGENRRGRQDRPTTPLQAAGERAEGRRHDRDVPARDRHDVARPRGREVSGEVTVDLVPQPDQDARGKARLRLRHRPLEAGRRDPTQTLEGARE
jgi:hypothetical protein